MFWVEFFDKNTFSPPTAVIILLIAFTSIFLIIIRIIIISSIKQIIKLSLLLISHLLQYPEQIKQVFC